MEYGLLNNIIEKKHSPNLEKALLFIKNNYADLTKKACDKYEVDETFFYIIKEHEPRSQEGINFEAHRQYIDIHFIFIGEEKMIASPLSALQVKIPFDITKDCEILTGKAQASFIVKAGECAIFYPEDAHIPELKCTEFSTKILKCIAKVKL